MRKIATLVCILFVVNSCTTTSISDIDHLLITIKREYKAPKSETVSIVISWDSLLHYVPTLSKEHVIVINQHFDNEEAVSFFNDGGEFMILTTTLASNEPVFTFKISNGSSKKEIVKNVELPTIKKLSVNFLTPYSTHSSKPEKPITDLIIESNLRLYPDVKDFTIISPGKWTYEHGFFLNAMYEYGKTQDKEVYKQYAKSWLDSFITETGQFKAGVYNKEEYRLDDILPGRLALHLIEDTGEFKYKVLVDSLLNHLDEQPKTSEGGYWHKEIYTNQMWLDGIYMGDVFSTQYAAQSGDTAWFTEAIHQIKLMHKYVHDHITGLMYHGWDESFNPVWAHPEKGHYPEFSTRAIGWYLMALIDCLDYIPAEYPERAQVELIFKNLASSILDYQHTSGLWYQVIDKGDVEGNWLETSASAMFSYAFAKGERLGLLNTEFKTAAIKSFDEIINHYTYLDKDGIFYLDQTGKVASLNLKNSKGDYEYYVNCERRINDYKGLGALLYAAIELKK
jgi:unsaturated rhamnogalacturonyl hydrolase